MKLKLAAAVLVILASSGCVTSTNSYTRDIVYRDGSYYSPADEQNGDYYYEPEPDYSYYDDYNYGFGYYGNSWYGGHSAYNSCRFSYRYDRYCDRGWGRNAFLNFGGLSIFFGSPNYYDYGYGYDSGYPHYGWHTPRPRPHNNGPIAMPKPGRPINQIPDYGFNNGPGIRVPGEPVRIPTKPGLIDQNPVEPIAEPQERENLNPYTRTREPRPNRSGFPRNGREDNGGNEGIVIRDDNPRQRRVRPSLSVDEGNFEPAEKPVRQDRRTQPYPQDLDSPSNRQQEAADTAPSERVVRDNRQERSAPRVQQRERIERPERSERPVREIRRESNDDGNGGQ